MPNSDPFVHSKRGDIIGVKKIPLGVNIDDRGLLSEIVRLDIPEVKDILKHETGDKIKQIYIVEDTTTAVRAFHKHKKLIDLFCVIKGSAKFILIDDRVGDGLHKLSCPTVGNYQIFNVSDRKLELLIVPHGVYHGWKGEKGTILLSIANEMYMGENRQGGLDEERIDWRSLGEGIWDTENK